MIGAIIGDIVGSTYEFSNTKDYNFPLYNIKSVYTDDSILTIAVAERLLDDESYSPARLSQIMRHYCKEYPCPMGGYGNMFSDWLVDSNVAPYNSWGNGSAIRVSATGWLFDTIIL